MMAHVTNDQLKPAGSRIQYTNKFMIMKTILKNVSVILKKILSRIKGKNAMD